MFFVRGLRFISTMALRMEAREKAIETIGMEGRHSLLPNSSSIQVLDTSLFQGKTRTPFSMRNPSITTCSGDSVTPAIALTSLAFVSHWNESCEMRTAT